MADSKKTPKSATKASKNAPSTERKGVYHKLVVTCACGAEFPAGSTLDTLRVDICSKCHPFFTGDKKIRDAVGRVERFRKKYSLTPS